PAASRGRSEHGPPAAHENHSGRGVAVGNGRRRNKTGSPPSAIRLRSSPGRVVRRGLESAGSPLVYHAERQAEEARFGSGTGAEQLPVPGPNFFCGTFGRTRHLDAEDNPPVVG